MLSAVLARRNLEHICDGEQELVGVVIFYQLQVRKEKKLNINSELKI